MDALAPGCPVAGSRPGGLSGCVRNDVVAVVPADDRTLSRADVFAIENGGGGAAAIPPGNEHQECRAWAWLPPRRRFFTGVFKISRPAAFGNNQSLRLGRKRRNRIKKPLAPKDAPASRDPQKNRSH